MLTIQGVEYAEMADAIYPANLRNLPFAPDAFLGYVDGNWPDYAQIAAEHGGKPCYGLTVTGAGWRGDGSDDEPGNTGIAQTPAITAAELNRGVVRPIVYCPASWAADMVNAHNTAGIARSRYRLLTAHYQGPTAAGAPLPGMHICGPATCRYGPGSDGTQWQNAGPYDRSILAPDFIAAASHPGTPSPIPKGTAIYMPALQLQPIASELTWPHGGVLLLGADGSVYAFGGAPFLGGANGKPYFAGRTAAQLVYRAATASGYGEGYTIIDTAGEQYNYDGRH